MADIEKLAREMVNSIVGKSEVRWVDEKALAKHYLALLDENTALRKACSSLTEGLKGLQHNTNSADDARIVAGQILHHAMRSWPIVFPQSEDEAQRKADELLRKTK